MDKALLKQKLTDFFKMNKPRLRDDLLRILREMVAEKTVNVPSDKLPNFDYLKIRGEEWRVAKILKREFDKWGIRYDVFERTEGRPNVIGYVGKGSAADRKLFIACHMDVVPPGPGWDSDPWTMVEKDGKVYGRGVLDNKGPLVSSMIAAYVFKSVVGEEFPGQLQVSGMADEEATDLDGIDYGVHYLMEEKLINPTYAIIPDIGENMQSIDVSEKGRMVVRVTAKGIQAHGSTPERGVNAINKMAHFLTAFEAYRLKFDPDPILIRPTVNVGEIHGGAAANIVPSECYCDIDIRIVNSQTPEGVRAEIEAIAASIAPDFVIDVQGATRPHAVSPDNILVRSIQANAKQFDLDPKPFGMGGSTFAKGMNEHGILSVAFGPGDDTAFHVANEFVDIEQLMVFAELICLIAIDLTME